MAITIASACNHVFRKLFLTPDTIGLIPAGGYTNNTPQSKNAQMWLAYREQTDACSIQHGRNGREYRLPEVPHLKVDGYCAETRRCMNLTGVIGTVVPVAKRYGTFPP
jgi:hypothetical protein